MSKRKEHAPAYANADDQRYAEQTWKKCQLCTKQTDCEQLFIACGWPLQQIIPEFINLSAIPSLHFSPLRRQHVMAICPDCQAELLTSLLEWRQKRIDANKPRKAAEPAGAKGKAKRRQPHGKEKRRADANGTSQGSFPGRDP